MIKSHFVLATLAATFILAGFVFADPTMGGTTMADHAPETIHSVTTTTADMMSLKLVGMDVYNKPKDKLAGRRPCDRSW